MKDSIEERKRLENFLRGPPPTMRRLVCPQCESEVTLRDYLLHCNNGHTMQTLAELKAVP